jgi:hypothetical protein
MACGRAAAHRDTEPLYPVFVCTTGRCDVSYAYWRAPGGAGCSCHYYKGASWSCQRSLPRPAFNFCLLSPCWSLTLLQAGEEM